MAAKRHHTRKMPNNGATQMCVYCGSAPATTHDHVPPKNLFPRPRPQLITVPSCAEHNKGAAKDDEYFRLSVVVNKDAAFHPAAHQSWQTTYRGLQRPQASGFKLAFLKSLEQAPVFSRGGLYLGETMTYAVDSKRQAQVVARTIRGLYYDQTGRILPDHHVLVYPIAYLAKHKAIMGRLWSLGSRAVTVLPLKPPRLTIGNGIFSCWWEELRGGSFSVWLLDFFSMSFVGFVIPKAHLPGGPRGFGFP